MNMQPIDGRETVEEEPNLTSERRRFLKAAGTVVLGVALPVGAASWESSAAAQSVQSSNRQGAMIFHAKVFTHGLPI